MIFGFFSRKHPSQQLDQPQTSDVDNLDVGRHDTPQALPPPPSPSPSPSAQPQVIESTALYSLIRSVPPQVFHAYSLDKLNPNNQNHSQDHPPPPPTVLTALTSFFSTLVPPPRLHCVRCHKSYFEVENIDRSCLVPHDDDSAEVERVPVSKTKGLGSEHETHWGCCGRTVEGDGDMGPPDGWCYEGKHTTDIKRARFRADATLSDDKLVPCSRLRCPGTSGQLLSPSPSSAPSKTARFGKKRARIVEDETEAEDPGSQTDAEKDPRSSPKRRRRTKSATSRRKSGASAAGTTSSEVKEEKEDQEDGKLDAMEVDPPKESASPSPPRPKPRRVRKSKPVVTDGNESAASSPPSTKTRPQPRLRKPKSSSNAATASTTSTPAANTSTTAAIKEPSSPPRSTIHKQQAEPQPSPPPKPKSTASALFKNTAPTPIPIPSNDSIPRNEPYKPSSAAPSLSDLSSIKSSSPSGTRIVHRVAYVDVPKLSFAKSPGSSKNSKVVAGADRDTDRETDKEDTKTKCPGPRPRSTRLKAKALSEVVETSVDAERV